MKTIALALFCLGIIARDTATAKTIFTDRFEVEKGELASTGTNKFFVLATGYQLVLQGQEGGKPTVLTVTVLSETKIVDGVETRVVEERETVNGEPIEISRNYFAISKRTTDVFYFGEDVDMYKNGKVTSHEGSWQSGVGGAHFGLAIPGTPLVGARYYQEMAPNIAMDRAEIVSVSEKLTTAAGEFVNCVKTEETSGVEKGKEYKVYAPGVGLIYDGELKLTKYGFSRL